MIHKLALIFSIPLLLALATSTPAAESVAGIAPGFYGGVSLRDGARGGEGIGFATPSSVWNRYATPGADELAPRTLLFGGYRWSNDVALEAAFSSVDKYALRPDDAGTRAQHGVGLQILPGASHLGAFESPSWNLDVFTTWTFYKSFALYGRLGYAQSDAVPAPGAASLAASDRLRLRDGVNYGVGLRYDMNSALGLRLEYGRFGRFVGESTTGFPDSDRVTFGVQFRF